MISKMKFEMLKLSGQIVKVLLMPASCGGDPGNPLNIIWMYKAAAKQKDIFDDQVTSLVSEYGGSWNYVAEPSYEDNNPMVASLRVTATADDGAKLEIQIPNSVDVNPDNLPQFTPGSGEAGGTGGDDSRFEALVMEHVGASFDKQLQLAEFLGEGWSWNLDTKAGALTFSLQNGRQIKVQVQILGSESYESETWLWSWANLASNLPPQLVSAAESLRQYGVNNGVSVFTEPQLPLEYVPGHMAAMVSSGLCKSRTYFCGPYGNGAVFLLIEQMPDLPQPPSAIARIATVFPQLLGAVPLNDHITAFDAYARYYGFETTVERQRVTARHAKQGELVAEFDGLRRMTNLTGSMQPV